MRKDAYKGSTRCPTCSGPKGDKKYRVVLADDQGTAKPLFVCNACATVFDTLINKQDTGRPQFITRKTLTEKRQETA